MAVVESPVIPTPIDVVCVKVLNDRPELHFPDNALLLDGLHHGHHIGLVDSLAERMSQQELQHFPVDKNGAMFEMS
jgi:hypothetical protein